MEGGFNVQTIKIILSVVLAVILIAPILMGIVRGWKKSAFRLAWVVVFGLLMFAFVGLISNAIVNMDLTSFNIEFEGQLVTNVPQYVEVMLSSSSPEMAQIIADNADVLTLAISLCVSLINLVLVVVLYWLAKWVLWPVWAIISHFIFKKKKVETTKIMQRGKVIGEKRREVKEKKHRWAGALFGLAMGIFSVGITAIPLAGISDTAMRIEQLTATEQEDGTTKGLLTQNLGENADILYVYTDSAAGKVLGAVGINAVSTAVAKAVATTNSNGQKISALDEIVDVTALSLKAQTLSEVDFQNLDKAGWAETLPTIREVADKALSMGLVGSLYDSIVPYVINGVLTDPEFFVTLPEFEDVVVEDLVKEVLHKFSSITFDSVKSDVLKLVDVAAELNNIDLLTELVKEEVVFEDIQAKLTTEFGQNVNDLLFEMNLISALAPTVVEGAVEILCNTIDVDYVAPTTDLTIEQVKQFFGSLFSDVIVVAKGYDDTKDIPIAPDTFENLGDIVDSLKQSGIVTTQTFNNVIDCVVDQIETEIADGNFKQSIQTLAFDMLADIKYIPSFKNELKQIGVMMDVIETEQIDHENLQIEPVTKLLDALVPTFLYQYNKDGVKDFVTDTLTEYCTESNLDIDAQTISTICNQIDYVYSYHLEYLRAKGLIEYVENFDFENDMTDQAKMATLGEHMDATVANQSVLFSDGNCKLILQSIIKNVDLPADINDITIDGDNIKVAMANNTSKITSYKTEFENIAKIMNIQNASTLAEYGKVLDGVSNSVLLDGILNEVVCQKIEQKAEEITDAEVKQIVKGITSNVENIQSFETEFAHLQKLVDADFENQTLSQIGETLDEVKTSALLDGAIDQIIVLNIERQTEDITDQDLVDVVEKVKQNVALVDNYQTEMEYMQQFVDLDAQNATMTQFGAMLDSFVDSVLFGGATNDLLTYALKKGKDQVDTMYKDIYNSVMDNVSNITGKIYEQELNYVQSFVDFTNNGEPKTLQNINEFLDNNILQNGNSKSVLIDNEICQTIRALAV